MASKDQTMGAGILGIAIILVIVYIWALFFSPWDMVIGDYPLRYWMFILPVAILVLGVLAIAGWIGYTMATTPPPKPLEDIPEFSEGAENKGASTPPPPPQEQK
jgi:predicted DNA-binding transcriptional regulator